MLCDHIVGSSCTGDSAPIWADLHHVLKRKGPRKSSVSPETLREMTRRKE